jgi:hypothetical protein
MKLFVVDRPGHLDRANVLMDEKVATDNFYYS